MLGGWRRLAIDVTPLLVVLAFVAWSFAGTRPRADSEISVDPPAPDTLLQVAHETEVALLDKSDGDCVFALDFETRLTQELAALKLSDWSIERSPGVVAQTCVGYGIDTTQHRILLISAVRGRVQEALKDVAEASYENCLTKAEVVSRVEKALNDQDQIGWEIRFDAPVGGPLDRLDAIVAHVKSGCFIYSGTGMSGEGQRLFFVVGPQ